MRQRLTVLAASLALGGGLAAVPAATPTVAVAKTCSSGFTSARIGGAHKCLRRGEYCARRYERQYRRYGYTCRRRGGVYRLS